MRCALVCLALLLALPAEAKTLLLTCQEGKTKYEVRYDTVRNIMTSTHRDFKERIDVEKTQENEDAAAPLGQKSARAFRQGEMGDAFLGL